MALTTTHAKSGFSPPDTHILWDDAAPVGWIQGNRVGFIGFGGIDEAAWAAWMAQLTIERRQGQRDGVGGPSNEAPPLALVVDGAEEWITGGGQRLARVIRPGVALPINDPPEATFAIEIVVPDTPSAITVRSTAYSLYRGIRRSRLPWHLFDDGARATPKP